MNVITQYLKNNPTSQNLYSRAIKVLPGGTTRDVLFHRPYPVYSRRGLGSRIWDVDGNQRIDYCFNYTALLLGHQYPKVMDSIREQLGDGTLLGQPTEEEVALAEKIVELVPSAEKVGFVGTGTEAIINAMRAAKSFTGKEKAVIFEMCYHGTSDPVMIEGTSTACAGVSEKAKEDIILVPFNDLDALNNLIKKNKEDIACVILEPIRGADGFNPPDLDYLKSIREITQDNDILLIFDEIVTGFRLAPGGAQELFNITPDITTLGKFIGGGVCGAAIAGIDEVMEYAYSIVDKTAPEMTDTRVRLSGTYNAHPLAMAAGLAGLSELKPSTYDHINSIGKAVRDGLNGVFEDEGISGWVTGFGSLFKIFFSKGMVQDYRTARLADRRIRWYFDLDMMNNGVYFSPQHHCCVSAVTTKEDIDTTLQSVRKTLSEIKPIIKKTSPNIII